MSGTKSVTLSKNERVQSVKRNISNQKFITHLFLFLISNIPINSSKYNTIPQSLLKLKCCLMQKQFSYEESCPQNFQKAKPVKCQVSIFNTEHQNIKKIPQSKLKEQLISKRLLWCSDKAFEQLQMKHILNIKQGIRRRKNFD